MINARKLLLALASDWDEYLLFDYPAGNLILLCNWLGMTPDEAYASLNHLHSVLRVPRRDKVYEEVFRPFHKSFIDYISDFTQSGFSPNMQHEAQQIKNQCVFRILHKAPNGVDFPNKEYSTYHGTLACGPGSRDKVSLTWLADYEGDWTDNGMRFNMYKLAIAEVVAGVEHGNPIFQSNFCIHLLAARFRSHDITFPHHQLRDLVFVSTL
jgi:hypothetical protein